jgi:signal transduction histidine kinase
MSAEKIVLNSRTHTLTAALDITERKRAEADREALIQELEGKNAELERFTYTVSHDLKSPLITIRGFLGFMEEDARAGNIGRLKADIARIENATSKMQLLLNDLLDLSRVGRLINPSEEISIETLAREAVALVAGRIAGRKVQIEITPGLPTVYGDRARLLEVMQNLLDNAVKFMGDQPRPTIEIGLRDAEPGQPVYYVRDNGIGIDSRYHQKVFGLFDKLEANSEGTGVGLALVKRIIEVHGGQVWIESAGSGTGTTVCFTLPPKPLTPTQQESKNA